jgi:hypothetical protein
MNCLVVWAELAFEQMSLILSRYPDRRAEFAATLKKISATLHSEPQTQGESREGNDRIWFVDDLLVSYEVDEESATVEIGSIRLSRR